MASREFTDSNGVAWRAWDVSPAYLHPITKEEDFMEPWVDGWLVFESELEKRRLVAPYPGRWHEYELGQLETLLKAAALVPQKRKETPSGERLAVTERDAEAAERATRERTFESPRGKMWRVRLHEVPRPGGTAEIVLRFTVGRSVVDLRDWPKDWKELSREQYALLILDAEPPGNS